VTLRTLPLPPVPGPARVLVLPIAVRLAVRQRAWDAVQSHERTLGQDVYRAGEGCHRGYLDALGTPAYRRLMYHRLVLALERRVYRTTPQIAAISRLGAAEIARLHEVPETRLTVVYNGVDLARFHPDHRARERAAARAEAGVPAGAWVVLFAGSGFARKGLDTALRALARARIRAQLWVAGVGDTRPWRSLAQALGVEGRVRFLGFRRDLPALYSAADALLLPTRYDAFANVCLEAAAAGLPVVTSGGNGAAELFRSAGRVVEDPDETLGFAAALNALADPELRRRLGAAARAVAAAHGWDVHVAALRALFAQVRA
jgi:UDP-glucose:(heptosyl)LPS alpha-1,3-glucosyltransferase